MADHIDIYIKTPNGNTAIALADPDMSEEALQALRDVVDCVAEILANKEVEEDTDG